jgi:hypothetical protein
LGGDRERDACSASEYTDEAVDGVRFAATSLASANDEVRSLEEVCNSGWCFKAGISMSKELWKLLVLWAMLVAMRERKRVLRVTGNGDGVSGMTKSEKTAWDD